MLLLFVYPHYTNAIVIVNVNHQQFQNNSRIIYLPHGYRFASDMPMMIIGTTIAESIASVISVLVIVLPYRYWLAIEFNDSLEN